MTDMPRCKTCRHWERDSSTLGWESADYAWGRCAGDLTKYLEVEVDGDATVKLTPFGLFGCVEWEAKP